jgi:RimJ/RimL family protein N-acetyltransferase
MSVQVLLRPLEESDFLTFLEIQGLALRSSPEVFGSDYDMFENLSVLSKEQRFERFINFPYQFLLGAFVSLDDAVSDLVGMVGFSCDHQQAKTRHKARTWGLFVREPFRGQGIATLLLEEIIRTARDVVGNEQIQLSISTHNEASFSLYLRLGFTVFGTERHSMVIDGAFVDEYYMVKFLR